VAPGFHTVALGVLAAGLAVNVFVRDGVALPQGVLGEAKVAAARVFQHAGVEIVWLDAITARGRRDFYTVRVEGRSPGELGSAAIGTRVATVFYGRVAQVAQATGSDVAMVLGHAAAHEIGHLLLGTTAHAASGIMQAQMDVAHAAQGRLLFNEEEARTLRARLNR
jgi:hypothetical protein